MTAELLSFRHCGRDSYDRQARGCAESCVGLCGPIVTGYLVEATGSFDSAFVAAGVLALIGATAALTLYHGTLGEMQAVRKLAVAS